MATSKRAEPADRPELVFALVRPTGCASSDLVLALTAELTRVGYSLGGVIKVSALLHGFSAFARLRADMKEDDRLEQHMDAGDELREKLDDGGALAYLTASDIARRRSSWSGSRAWIIDSLKHRHEVKLLRKLYGQQLIVVSVYDDEENRVKSLARKIAKDWKTRQGTDDRARELIRRDFGGSDTAKNGQDVRETFPLADYFVSLGQDLRKQISRLIETLFGKPSRSPTRDEYAMCVARSVALRSADLSRQVGAVIVDADGEVVVAGCNEVPKAGGGVYWEGDAGDSRDYTIGYDPNVATSNDMLTEMLDRLKKSGWLAESFAGVDSSDLADRARRDSIFKKARSASLVEFGRVIHAEMNALMRAAAGGLAIRGMRMVCTTFPCHVCARHLIGAGLSEVVYIEPYPKSLATHQYPESILVGEKPSSGMLRFRPFAGWSPSRYVRIFEFGERKDPGGHLDEWDPTQIHPKIAGSPDAHKYVEEDLRLRMETMLKVNGFERIEESPSNQKGAG